MSSQTERPEPQGFSDRMRRDWFRTYLDDIIQKDVRDITEIRKMAVLRQVAVWLLAHSAQSFTLEELAALVDADGGCVISHYRDSNKREIDFLVENDRGELLGIEVKAGTFSQGDFNHLRWFAQHLAPSSFTGIVLYSGKATLPFGEGFYAVPLSALGS